MVIRCWSPLKLMSRLRASSHWGVCGVCARGHQPPLLSLFSYRKATADPGVFEKPFGRECVRSCVRAAADVFHMAFVWNCACMCALCTFVSVRHSRCFYSLQGPAEILYRAGIRGETHTALTHRALFTPQVFTLTLPALFLLVNVKKTREIFL